MKNKLYFVLLLFYAVVTAVVLYVNGVFTGAEGSPVNLLINLGFLVVIGILFLISIVSFGRLNRVTDELSAAAVRLQQEYRESSGANLWETYRNRDDVFENEALRDAFDRYRARVQNARSRRGYVNACPLEEYINEDLLDRVGMNFFNSGVSGALTGLGILGTFLGLSMGLGSFSGDDIYTISDNVGPLLSGMKVAFHTSVYGIFFSLIFNVVYRSIMADAYEKLERFLNVFRETAMPTAMTGDENSSAMVVHQANISKALKQMLRLMQGTSGEQIDGVGRIVDQFTERMQESLSTDFRELGDSLRAAGGTQQANAESMRELLREVTALAELERNTQSALVKVMERQEEFSRQLQEQKQKLAETCEEMSDEISAQLYAFDQMRSLYEK